MTRLFVAVWPPAELRDRLADLERPRDRGVRWVDAENLHVTLRYLGDADEAEVIERLVGVELPRVTAVFGPAVDVLAERSLILPVAGVDELAAVVGAALRGLGTRRPPRRFVGHLTLAKLARGARPDRCVGRRFDAAADIDDVALVASTLTPERAVYETVVTFPTR